MNHVYVANFGEGNALWPVAKEKSVILTVDNTVVHPFWQQGDRDGYVSAAMNGTLTARREKPSKPTAGRWWNLMEEVRDTEDDVWITRQEKELWWTVSIPGPLHEELQASLNTKRDGDQVWRIEKRCRPWSNRDRKNGRLDWDALHPKAKDFLATEATFQRIANDRGYADFIRALVAGNDLSPWTSTTLFEEKLAASKKKGYKQFTPREVAAAEMTRQLFKTVAGSNGQQVLKTVKNKMTDLSPTEWEAFLLKMIDNQNSLCQITGLPFHYKGESEDHQMWPSLDRIDSNGHYTTDNVQIVCRFMNRWKGADDDAIVRRLIGAIRSVPEDDQKIVANADFKPLSTSPPSASPSGL